MFKNKQKRTIVIICLAVLICAAIAVSLIFLSGRQNDSDAGNDRSFTVTFYSDDGSILKIESVLRHQSATPPVEPEISYGNVFVKWDAEFSDVTADIDVHPVVREVKAEKNAFVLSGAYGQKETDVIVPLQLCGEVLVSGFDIRIKYDPDALELLSVFNVDGGVVYNDSEAGVVILNYVSVENTTADVDICKFKFRVRAQSGEFPITASVVDICASEGDDIYKTDFVTVDSSVYVY